ncbi:MAG: hypothetical protein IJB41_09175, partial [Clostridia bacterium]|nr:hypothetical protein [Clostridia bacterium]
SGAWSMSTSLRRKLIRILDNPSFCDIWGKRLVRSSAYPYTLSKPYNRVRIVHRMLRFGAHLPKKRHIWARRGEYTGAPAEFACNRPVSGLNCRSAVPTKNC